MEVQENEEIIGEQKEYRGMMRTKFFVGGLIVFGLIIVTVACFFSGNVSGAISYTPASGSLSSTTSLNNGFVEQLYDADKAGTLTLYTATKTGNGSSVALTYPLSPADFIVLGGDRKDLYVTVTLWDATLSSMVVRVHGIGINNTAIYENLTFTGNGSKFVTKYYQSINSTKIYSWTGTGSITVALFQGQWGRVWKTGPRSYRFVNCTPALSGYYNQTNTSLSFYPSSTVCINFGTSGKAIFGNLSSSGVPRWGCTFVNEKNVNVTIAATAAVTYIKFYACSFMSIPSNRSTSSLRISETLGLLDIRNCLFSFNSEVISGGTNSIYKRNTFVSSKGGVANLLGTTGSADDLFFDNVSIPISMGTSAVTVYNCSVNNYDYLFKWTPIGLTPIKHFLRNFKVLGGLKCQYLGTATGFVEVRLQYGLNIRVRNGTSNLSGVSVKYFEINSSSLVRKRVQSLISGADGVVAYKYLNRSIWIRGRMYPSSNYTVMVWVNKTGYQSVCMNFTMSREMIFDVVLLKNVTGGIVTIVIPVGSSGSGLAMSISLGGGVGILGGLCVGMVFVRRRRRQTS